MFVIQRVLEVEGKLTLLDQSRVISPHQSFRMFATTNTIGLGDPTGLYHGTQQINQGQMDRWNIVTTSTTYPTRARSISSRRSTLNGPSDAVSYGVGSGAHAARVYQR